MARKEVVGAIILGAFFIAATILADLYADQIRVWLDLGAWGVVIYASLTIVATVVAPVSALPFLPVAVTLWGPFFAALLSLFGWLIGAIIAFWIARRWGRPIVARFVNLKKAEEYEHLLGERHVFWQLVFLRMTVPVDILSYAIGLFTRVSWRVYIPATFIGNAPFAFIFAYASDAPLWIRVAAVGAAGAAVLVGYSKVRRAYTRRIQMAESTLHAVDSGE